MAIIIDGNIVQIECDRRVCADVIFPMFSAFGLNAQLRVADDDDVMQAGGGWEAIKILVDHSAAAPLVVAAAAAGGIAAGEIVKEVTKDAYKAIKATIRKCIAKTSTRTVLPRERFLGFRIYILPQTDNRSERLALDISFKSSSSHGMPISVPDSAIEEAFWLFENRLAPLLIRTRVLSPRSGQRMDLRMDENGGVDRSDIHTEFSDGKRFAIHGSRDGFHIDDRYMTLLEERLPHENPALWTFIKSHLQNP